MLEGFIDGSDAKNQPAMQETWVGKIPRGGHGNPLQYSCLESPHRQRSLVGYSPWGLKESDTTETTWHTHSSDRGGNGNGVMIGNGGSTCKIIFY